MALRPIYELTVNALDGGPTYLVVVGVLYDVCESRGTEAVYYAWSPSSSHAWQSTDPGTAIGRMVADLLKKETKADVEEG